MRSVVTLNFYKVFKFRDCAITIRDAFLCRSTTNNIFVIWLFVPNAILWLLLSPIIFFTSAVLATLVDLIGPTSSSFPPDSTHVPTFYVPEHRYTKWYHILLLMALGVIFGLIHCSGWDFSFPTYTEQKLWRVASLVVTVIPIIIMSLAAIIVFITTYFPILEPFITSLMISGWPLILSPVGYVSARLILLGLAFALLRHLPPTTFIAVDWAKFYPHFY